MGKGINVGYINESKGIAIAITEIKERKKPCLVVQKDNVFDIVATFSNEMAADRFASALHEFVKGI